MASSVPSEVIEQHILVIRGQKVMLNADMAKHTTMVHTLNRWEEIIDN
jgi:hypothetical protein